MKTKDLIKKLQQTKAEHCFLELVDKEGNVIYCDNIKVSEHYNQNEVLLQTEEFNIIEK